MFLMTLILLIMTLLYCYQMITLYQNCLLPYCMMTAITNIRPVL